MQNAEPSSAESLFKGLWVCTIWWWGLVYSFQLHSSTLGGLSLSVLICFDRCSLIIENNKVRSFLSCLVCCLSLWPRLSDAAVCPDPLDPKGSPVISGLGETGHGSVCLLQRVRSSVSCERNVASQLIITAHHTSSFPLSVNISKTDASLRVNNDILYEVPLSNGILAIIICHVQVYTHTYTHHKRLEIPGKNLRVVCIDHVSQRH